MPAGAPRPSPSPSRVDREHVPAADEVEPASERGERSVILRRRQGRHAPDGAVERDGVDRTRRSGGRQPARDVDRRAQRRDARIARAGRQPGDGGGRAPREVAEDRGRELPSRCSRRRGTRGRRSRRRRGRRAARRARVPRRPLRYAGRRERRSASTRSRRRRRDRPCRRPRPPPHRGSAAGAGRRRVDGSAGRRGSCRASLLPCSRRAPSAVHAGARPPRPWRTPAAASRSSSLSAAASGCSAVVVVVDGGVLCAAAAAGREDARRPGAPRALA